MEGKERYEMGGSGAAFALDRMYHLTEPEVLVDNLGSLGMKVSSSFGSKLGSISHFSIISHLYPSSHTIYWKNGPSQFPPGR